MISFFRALTRTGWLVVGLALVAVLGWARPWYWPMAAPVMAEKPMPAPAPKEAAKWPTKKLAREVRALDPPPKEREKAEIRADEELLARGVLPPCPGGATVDAILTPSGDTRLSYTPKRPPFVGFLEEREISAWSNLGDRHQAEYRQNIVRLGQAHIAGRLFAENRRGEFGGGGMVGVAWRF